MSLDQRSSDDATPQPARPTCLWKSYPNQRQCTLPEHHAGRHVFAAAPLASSPSAETVSEQEHLGSTEKALPAVANQQQEPKHQQSESGPLLGLWVDDCKPAPSGCAVARTYDDALRMMRRYRYATLYLDHDLGEARTGYDLLMQVIAEGCAPPTLECISWNPVGRQRIAAAWAEHTASNAAAASVVLAVDRSRSSPNEVAPAAALTPQTVLGEAPLASAPTRHLDYPEAARVIALYLEEFCNPELRYPDMIADAARKAAASLQSERLARETAAQQLAWIRLRCRIVFYPGDLSYPIEHTLFASKDMWDALMAEYDRENPAAPHPETRHE